jgi:hypothetical protein
MPPTGMLAGVVALAPCSPKPKRSQVKSPWLQPPAATKSLTSKERRWPREGTVNRLAKPWFPPTGFFLALGQ